MSEAKKGKILAAARSVFLRYGYRRVSMSDIAEAAGVSRPALYVLFKSKEEIFGGVYTQWVDETITAVQREIASTGAPGERLERAFEVWSVRPFEAMMGSSEAKELLDGSLEFVQASLRQGYARFETAIVPVLAEFAERHRPLAQMGPERAAHVLAGAIGGFKLTAITSAELRRLIHDLLDLSLGS